MSTGAKIVAGLILVFLIIVGIKFLSDDTSSNVASSGIVSEDFGSSDLSENGEFLRVLKNLESVSLDSSILSSEAFASFVDFSIELKEEPKGRQNPFRPINPLERDLATFQATSTP